MGPCRIASSASGGQSPWKPNAGDGAAWAGKGVCAGVVGQGHSRAGREQTVEGHLAAVAATAAVSFAPADEKSVLQDFLIR